MKFNNPLSILLLAIASPFSCGAFITGNAPVKTSNRQSVVMHSTDRRAFLQNGASALATGSIASLLPNVQPAFADVSDGDLPQGAAQFSRVLKVQKDLAALEKKVTESTEKFDKKEWDSVSDFFRKLYSAGEDMKTISKGIYDPAKKKEAESTIKLLQKVAQAGDGPVAKQDTEALLVLTKKGAKLIDDFFELLRDVPDEI